MSVIAAPFTESSYCFVSNFTPWWGNFTFVSRFSQRETKHQRNDNPNGQRSTLFIYLLIYLYWRLLRTAADKQTVWGHQALRDWVWNPAWPSQNRAQGTMKAPGEKTSIKASVLRADQQWFSTQHQGRILNPNTAIDPIMFRPLLYLVSWVFEIT